MHSAPGLMIPSAGTPINALDLLWGVFGIFRMRAFRQAFERWAGTGWFCFVNSGTTACYVILEALKRLTPGTEVVLPAYTAPSLLLPIRKAGLTPVFCDIDVKTLNMDDAQLERVVTSHTLCIMPVHMFGLPCDLVTSQRIAGHRGVFLVEDAASAMGSQINGRPVGTLGDVGFFSFNRGKNLSTLTGGCIVSRRADLQHAIAQECARLPSPDLKSKVRISADLVGLSLAVRPLFYTMLYPFISRFKYTGLHPSFESSRYTEVQAGVGASLMKRADAFFAVRQHNGLFLHEALSDLGRIGVPRIVPNTVPVFNQFPIVFEDQATRDRARDEIVRAGIEATILYPYPMHRIRETLENAQAAEAYATRYDLSHCDPFPNATYVAERLLLIPTHPGIKPKHLSKVVDVLRRTVA